MIFSPEKVSAYVMKYALWVALVLICIGFVIAAFSPVTPDTLFHMAAAVILAAPLCVVGIMFVYFLKKKDLPMALITTAYIALLIVSIAIKKI